MASGKVLDIEDMHFDHSESEDERRKEVNTIKKNFTKKQRQNRAFDKQEREEKEKVCEGGDCTSQIPGTQKIYVKTFGCSHNVSDSEYMMGQLVEYGYRLTDDPLEADLLLINSCTVKNPSQESLMRQALIIPGWSLIVRRSRNRSWWLVVFPKETIS